MPSYAFPAFGALIGAAFWGLLWLPIRLLEENGLTGAWPGVLMMLGTLPFLGFLSILQRNGPSLARRAVFGALLAGSAVMLYSTALTQTDVVRAVLLFYLAPVWSTILECMFMERRWTWHSTLALGVSFLGILFIFRGDIAFNAWTFGDGFATFAGLCWAVGTALIFAEPSQPVARLTLITVLGGIICTFPLSWSLSSLPQTALILDNTLALLGFGLFYLVPVLLITIWSASHLPPALLSFLLTAEIISGILSSAVFLDERFGWPEALGAVLVCCGTVVEMKTQNHHATRTPRG